MSDELVGGRYRLGRPLGAGGMGKVWEATDTVLQRPVAVKAVDLPPHLDSDDRTSLRARVMREARAAARIDHPSSVRVFDVLEDEGRLHVVMELVRAPTLEALVAEQGPLAPARVAAMGLGVLGALEAAHAAGIVHRDVKPANVMMLDGDGVKLADFGIASVKDDTRITAAGLVLGTPSYMAPEQALGRPTGGAADLWGLGALLYFAVEGVAPFDRGEALPTLNAVLHDPPRPMERADGLAPALSALLVKDPEARATAAESRAALERVTASQEVATSAAAAGSGATAVMPAAATAVAAPAPDRRSPPPTTGPPAPPPPSPFTRPAPGGSWGWLAGLAAVVVVIAIALILALNTGGDDEQAFTDAGPDTSAPEETVAPEDPAPTAPRATARPDTSPAPTAAPPAEPDGARPDGVPGDWIQHRDDSGRYTIWHPPSWTPTGGPGSGTDFVDPATGDYLRVDFVSTPGDDPVEAWEDASDRFADRYDSYEEIGIEATQYQGYDAALWEYTYEGLHATNLGVVAADDLGFALNFQTGEARWEDRQSIRRAFEAGFRLTG
ncbi:MAG: serine/threonine protein kinase [Actinobacteria bacterium]|nr:serine/threonine protein kinase [Actinomycetota bacterium]